ncbi:hypothetical protein HS7_06830 [Sulfolobales archaeon HS-7]|nr:hypothetical protein HS7_06830 [Sulfolobales archaeon HS-7]
MEICDNREVDICLTFDEKIRLRLSRPYGRVIKSPDKIIQHAKNFDKVYVVGDYVLSILMRKGFSPTLSIADRKTRRNIPVVENIRGVEIRNEPGVLRISALEKLRELLTSGYKGPIYVDGEEDMLVIPLVIFGSENSLVLYGQPFVGTVLLEINQLTKWIVRDILQYTIPQSC